MVTPGFGAAPAGRESNPAASVRLPASSARLEKVVMVMWASRGQDTAAGAAAPLGR